MPPLESTRDPESRSASRKSLVVETDEQRAKARARRRAASNPRGSNRTPRDGERRSRSTSTPRTPKQCDTPTSQRTERTSRVRNSSRMAREKGAVERKRRETAMKQTEESAVLNNPTPSKKEPKGHYANMKNRQGKAEVKRRKEEEAKKVLKEDSKTIKSKEKAEKKAKKAAKKDEESARKSKKSLSSKSKKSDDVSKKSKKTEDGKKVDSKKADSKKADSKKADGKKVKKSDEASSARKSRKATGDNALSSKKHDSVTPRKKRSDDSGRKASAEERKQRKENSGDGNGTDMKPGDEERKKTRPKRTHARSVATRKSTATRKSIYTTKSTAGSKFLQNRGEGHQPESSSAPDKPPKEIFIHLDIEDSVNATRWAHQGVSELVREGQVKTGDLSDVYSTIASSAYGNIYDRESSRVVMVGTDCAVEALLSTNDAAVDDLQPVVKGWNRTNARKDRYSNKKTDTSSVIQQVCVLTLDTKPSYDTIPCDSSPSNEDKNDQPKILSIDTISSKSEWRHVPSLRERMFPSKNRAGDDDDDGTISSIEDHDIKMNDSDSQTTVGRRF